ncbi:hypothetical protein SOVF_189010 [Spinacia oleracea]|nr:hypothetical protein SOVF_189010 [Spinacia oleracea]
MFNQLHWVTASSIILVNNLRVLGPGLNPFAPYNMANYFSSSR